MATRSPVTGPTRRIRVLQGLWIAGFAVGTTTHVADLAIGGADVYAGFPTAVRLFWVALTVLDPLVIVLVLLRRRAGLVLGVAVMLADIAVNWSVYLGIGGIAIWGVVNQTVFTVFVLASARALAGWFRQSTPPSRKASQ
jgi:hypothetical protein